MEIICTQCDQVTAIPIEFRAEGFACTHCNSFFDISTGRMHFKKKFNDLTNSYLSVGQKGVLEDVEYVVAAVLVKKTKSIYYWREYTLVSATGEKRFISETDGHWILLKQVPELYEVENRPRTLTHDNISMHLFEYSSTTIAAAEGFFDYELPLKSTNLTEYIEPPYIISIEHGYGEEATFFGHHISKNTVKKAFGVTDMPPKSGVGMVQPYAINVRNFVIIVCSFALLILFSHLYIYSDSAQQKVLDEYLLFDVYTGKDFVSRPFELKGGSAPLTIKLQSDVDNSWANVQVGLINEKTNEEIYASKDVEYYHGYTDGENWSEGSQSEDFNICGVAAGTYHLIVTPQKPPENTSAQAVKVNVVWNEPSMWNVYLPLIIMAIACLVAYYAGVYFEQKRWENSSYAPE